MLARSLSYRLSPVSVSLTRPFSSSSLSLDTWDSPKPELVRPSNLPDFIEKWNPTVFRKVGVGLGALSAYVLATQGIDLVSTATIGATAAYWWVGLNDEKQTAHAVRKNFPVLGNLRYLLESVRPEVRQYFIENDTEARPFSRDQRAVIYQRAKGVSDTLPLGTRMDVYSEGYEFCAHSLYPRNVLPDAGRVLFGATSNQPYSANLINISAMSYGALSPAAIRALGSGAKMGGFSLNTGEGGVSRFHLETECDIVWNVGTGYFGCRHDDGTFNAEMFAERAANPSIKMIELKLSQGAKPAHGGVLPFAKLSEPIAEARGIDLSTWGTKDVNSPPRHNAFTGPHSMLQFIQQLRELSGKPVGIKLCVGSALEFCALVRAMVDLSIVPDFITIDGAEGGTGAAPPEFSNAVGMPLREGLRTVHTILTGAGLRSQIRLIASGRVVTGFDVVRLLALGADTVNQARAMMMALGCIQSLKCHSNKCPTGITTQEESLQKGLDVADKSYRVFNAHEKTLHSALELVGAIGLDTPAELRPDHLYKRVSPTKVERFSDIYPSVYKGSLLQGNGPRDVQELWDAAATFRSQQAK